MNPPSSPLHVSDLVVQGEEGHRGLDGLPTLGTQTHHLEARLVDLLRELVHRDVRGGTHQHLAVTLLGQMVHHSGRGDRLACARGTLHERTVTH